MVADRSLTADLHNGIEIAPLTKVLKDEYTSSGPSRSFVRLVEPTALLHRLEQLRLELFLRFVSLREDDLLYPGSRARNVCCGHGGVKPDAVLWSLQCTPVFEVET